MERAEAVPSPAEICRRSCLHPGLRAGWGGGVRELIAFASLDMARAAETWRVVRELRRSRSLARTLLADPRAGPMDWQPLAVRPCVSVSEDAFSDLSLALEPGGAADLKTFLWRQSLVEHEWATRPEARRALLRRLLLGGHLLPARHFCYETSRDDERYSERLGFCFPALVRRCAKEGDRGILLELGQGSGACLDGRRPYARDYLQVGCCDALRYTLRDFLLAGLDRDALQRGIAARTGRPDWQAPQGFWKDLCTFAAKVLVLRAGVSPSPEAAFDEDVLASLATDANALSEIFRAKAPLLARTEYVPASEGAPHPERAGDFLYPNWERMPNDVAFRAACDLLAGDGPGHLIVGSGKRDAIDVLPVYPCGTVLGDFRDLAARLRPGQVRLAVGVRSTQALDGQEYIDFMASMARLLEQGDSDEHGVYVDDNARKNYGAYYPLEELCAAERAAGFPFFVVRGRGPEPWEEDVPVAVVVTRSRQKLGFIANSLRPGFRLQRPGEMLDDSELRSALARRPGEGRGPPT